MRKNTRAHNTSTHEENPPKCAEDLTTMAGRFIAARKSVGLTATACAEQIGVHKGTVSRIEQGHTQTLKGETLLNMEAVTLHRAMWITRGEGPRYCVGDDDGAVARRLAFSMNHDQLKQSILNSIDGMTREEIRSVLDVLLDYL